MDLVTQCKLPFQQMVEALTAALARRGFTIRRDFDLQNAAGKDAAADVNYTVLLIRPERDVEQLQVVVAYERAGRLTLTLSSGPVNEQRTSLGQALAEVLVELGCWSWEEPLPDGRVVDPVCGKALDPLEAHAMIEWNGQPIYLCCPLCQAAFEREPQRYMK